ncbi:MAG: hypothetical protein LLG13_11525 [Bacteroidales bacterium]|nr:hypothetical protein [Bacteroidales bacterium]
MQDVRLVIEINNKQPLELMDLTKSFISLANQFNNFVSENGDSKENREAKLFVKEIKTGSVIMELVELATVGIIPYAENINTIVDFSKYIGSAFNFILGKSKEKPKELTPTDYRDLSQIINPIATDNASQLNISTKIDGNVYLSFHIDSLEANAAQNIMDRFTKDLKTPEDNTDIKTKVLLTFYQIRANIKAKSGNKGVIDDISKSAVNIVFDDEGLNEEMLHGDFNPNETVYVVDVIPQTVNGKLAAYKIIKLHDTFSKEDTP